MRKKLSAGAVHVLRILQRLTTASAKRGIPFAYPRRERLAAETGAALRSIERWLAELRRAGLLQSKRAPQVGGRNEYYVVGDTESGVLRGMLSVAMTEASGTGDPDATSGHGPRAADPPRAAQPLPPALAEPHAPPLAAAHAPGVAQPDAPPPLYQGLEMNETQQKQAEALPPVVSLREAAQHELLRLGVGEPMAGKLARTDPHLAIVAAAHFRTLQGTRPQDKKRPGLLVTMCQQPRSFGFRRLDVSLCPGNDPFAVWAAPDGSPVHALREKQQQAHKRQVAKDEARKEEAVSDAAAADRSARAKAAWASLDEFEQAGIDQALMLRYGVNDGRAGLLDKRRTPVLWREACEMLALETVEAMADATAWAKVPDEQRLAAEKIAHEQEPLFATDQRRMQWLRWLALEQVKRKSPTRKRG